MKSNTRKSQKPIEEQVNRICSSEEFRSKKSLCRFLIFIVKETLAGREEELKGYTIGIGVFNRGADFDPEYDPIVRIQAGRLRRSLQVYYLGEGKNDSIQIVIPKGKYIPRFLSSKEMNDEVKKKPDKPMAADQSSFVEPSIAVLPFKNLTGDPGKVYFVEGFSEEISTELTLYEDLIVISSLQTSQAKSLLEDSLKVSEWPGVHFILEGSVRLDDEKVTILIRLTDLLNHEQIWAERYQYALSANNLIKIQENIARETARQLGSEYGIILQRLSRASMARKPTDLNTYDAILRFYYYEIHFTREAAKGALSALTLALQKNPASGIATAMLASLYGNFYMLDIPGNEDALEKTKALAEKALKLDPNSLMIRIIHAWKCFVCNEKERFFEESEYCLTMNLNSPLKIGAMGFHLALYGDWERGKVLLDKAMQYHFGFPRFLYGATTLYYYRKRNYDRALQEALNYDVPALFWGPMLRIAVLGQLNRLDEIPPERNHLNKLKPDFEVKARILISRFVKESEVADHIIDGLCRAGIKLKTR